MLIQKISSILNVFCMLPETGSLSPTTGFAAKNEVIEENL